MHDGSWNLFSPTNLELRLHKIIIGPTGISQGEIPSNPAFPGASMTKLPVRSKESHCERSEASLCTCGTGQGTEKNPHL